MKIRFNYGIEEKQRDNEYRCDLMPWQSGLINPKLYTRYESKRRRNVTEVTTLYDEVR